MNKEIVKNILSDIEDLINELRQEMSMEDIKANDIPCRDGIMYDYIDPVSGHAFKAGDQHYWCNNNKRSEIGGPAEWVNKSLHGIDFQVIFKSREVAQDWQDKTFGKEEERDLISEFEGHKYYKGDSVFYFNKNTLSACECYCQDVAEDCFSDSDGPDGSMSKVFPTPELRDAALEEFKKQKEREDLLKEAKRRYPRGTKYKDIAFNEVFYENTLCEPIWWNKYDSIAVQNNKGLVYHNGKWAEIITEPEFKEGDMIAVRDDDNQEWKIREFIEIIGKYYRCNEGHGNINHYVYAKKLTDFNKR